MSERDHLNEAEAEIDPAVSPADESAEAERRDRDHVRRPLIRATLKPQEGVPPTPRQPPVFTMHQQQPRGGPGAGRGNFRARAGRPDRENGRPDTVDGNRARPARRNERGGQHRANGTPRSASSRRGRGRSR